MRAMSTTEHQEYWIKEFNRRLSSKKFDDDEKQMIRELLSSAIKEWRRHKTLTPVK